FRRQPDGMLTTDLLPEEEAAAQWGGRTPFGVMVQQASEGDWRLLRKSMVRGDEGERPYLSLGHDALAHIAAGWAEGLRRAAWFRSLLLRGAALFLFLALIGGAGLWLRMEQVQQEAERRHREAELTQAVAADLEKAIQAQSDHQFNDAQAALERAEGRL